MIDAPTGTLGDDDGAGDDDDGGDDEGDEFDCAGGGGDDDRCSGRPGERKTYRNKAEAKRRPVTISGAMVVT